MTQTLIAVAVTSASLVALSNWQRGLALCWAIGLLQDPVRKAIAGQPAWILLAFVPVAICSCAGLLRAGNGLNGKHNWPLGIALIVGLLGLSSSSLATLVIAPNANGLCSIALGWVGPVIVTMGVLIGMAVGQTSGWALASFRTFVLSISAVLLVGHIPEQLCSTESLPNWIGTMPPNRPWMHTLDTRAFVMASGLFRSPENAGWFSATVACLGLCLYLLEPRQFSWKAMVWLSLVGIAIMCCMLSGRRKMQLIMLIGIAVQLVWLAGQQRSLFRSGVLALLFIVPLSVLALATLSHDYAIYVDYAASSITDAADRTAGVLGIGLERMAADAGLFGNGLGTMAPGGQHIGLIVHRYVEGGLLRVAYESGYLGLSCFTVAIGLLGLVAIRRIGLQEPVPNWNYVRISLFGGSLGHLVCFCFGHQIFGDPLVLATSGFMFGIGIGNCKPYSTEPVGAASNEAKL